MPSIRTGVEQARRKLGVPSARVRHLRGLPPDGPSLRSGFRRRPPKTRTAGSNPCRLCLWLPNSCDRKNLGGGGDSRRVSVETGGFAGEWATAVGPVAGVAAGWDVWEPGGGGLA